MMATKINSLDVLSWVHIKRETCLEFRWNMFRSNMFVNELFTSHVSFKHVSYLVLIYAVLLYLHKFLKRQLQNGA